MPTLFTPNNFTPATAYEIPQSGWGWFQEDLLLASAPDFDVWFKYVPKSREAYVSVTIEVLGDSNYFARIAAFTGTPDSLTAIINNTANPITIPTASGDPVYLRIRQTHTGVQPVGQIKVSFTTAPFGRVPIGSIIVPDDTAGFPAAVIDAETGRILGYIDLPAGESGAVLADGTLLTEDNDAGVLRLFDPTFHEIAVVPVDLHGAAGYITTNRVDRFWAGYAGNASAPEHARVTVVEKDGTVGTTYDLGGFGMVGIAVSPDESILYWTGLSSTINTPVKRWDLINNVPLSDLVASPAPTAHHEKDLLSFPDGSLVVPYRDGASAYIKRYDASGSVLNTYTLPLHAEHLTYAGTDDTSFWVWMQGNGGLYDFRFQQIRLSDGSVLADVMAPFFGSGVSDFLETPERFGVSSSCPVMTTTVPFTIPPPIVVVPPAFCECVPPPTNPPKLPPPITPNPPPLAPTIGQQLVCAGGGVVPTQPDVVYSETWWAL